MLICTTFHRQVPCGEQRALEILLLCFFCIAIICARLHVPECTSDVLAESVPVRALGCCLDKTVRHAAALLAATV